MAYEGKLIQVGPDAVGYIDCDQLEYLYSFRVADIVNINDEHSRFLGEPEAINGLQALFRLESDRAVEIVLTAAATNQRALGAGA